MDMVIEWRRRKSLLLSIIFERENNHYQQVYVQSPLFQALYFPIHEPNKSPFWVTAKWEWTVGQTVRFRKRLIESDEVGFWPPPATYSDWILTDLQSDGGYWLFTESVNSLPPPTISTTERKGKKKKKKRGALRIPPWNSINNFMVSKGMIVRIPRSKQSLWILLISKRKKNN